ncbi:MAG TPA: T9SS type A sorting domain-containing protein [Bacteroidia bacterium]|nr:T9SS type A sorting domain-containing protein [Bacteroidia bacterium]
MKKFLFSVLFCQGVVAFAQPVIQPFTPLFGATINVFDITDSIPINFPMSGNQSWDFSNAITQSSFSITLVDPISTPYTADFPTANFAQTINSGTTPLAYFYGVINQDSLYGLGARSVVIPTANFNYIDPNVSFRFPMNYLTTISDISTDNQGDWENDTRKYIAYGDVVTPFGTYNNVAMFRDQEWDSTGALISTKFLWASVANLNTIIEIDSSDGTGNVYDLSSLTSIGQLKLKDKYSYSLSSNFSNGNDASLLSLLLNEQANVTLELFSAEGKSSESLINNQILNGQQQIGINTNGLTSGIYFLKLQIGNDVIVEKMIVI